MNFDLLAYEIGINKSRFATLIVYADDFYKTYHLRKRDGSNRTINAPGVEIKFIQIWILRNILEKSLTPSEYSKAFYKRRGIKLNASSHLGKKYIYCFDIKNFFPSITVDRVTKLFSDIPRIDSSLASQLAKICTYKGYLPQGAITSPYISNIVLKEIDENIGDYCSRKNISYSRYADDLVFSSDNFDELVKIKGYIEPILTSYDFTLNKKKERMLTGAGKMVVTGLRLNSGKLTIGRDRKRLYRAMLHRLLIKEEAINEKGLIGHLSFLQDIEPTYYKDNWIPYRDKLIKKKEGKSDS